MTAPFTVRPLGREDLAWVCEAEAESLQIPWNKALLAEELVHPNAVCLAGLARGQGDWEPAAYAFFRVQVGEMHLFRLAVLPPFRGRGLGLFLARACLIEAARQGADTAWLEVRNDNVPARRLYARAGFSEVGIRRRYYADTGEDAVIMSMPLDGLR
ncbi:MAG: ribosomal protein S18-alanine N-acetyltransferase [Proteobacteria bacterium]|nr:ribosomal protein S18-alanine N-acetyltransferase [Pseudomonadota bacterium]